MLPVSTIFPNRERGCEIIIILPNNVIVVINLELLDIRTGDGDFGIASVVDNRITP